MSTVIEQQSHPINRSNKQYPELSKSPPMQFSERRKVIRTLDVTTTGIIKQMNILWKKAVLVLYFISGLAF